MDRTVAKKTGILHNKRGTNNKLFQIRKRYKTRIPFISISFILVLEIAFIKIKRNPNIKSLNVCNNDFLYTAYADDIIIFYIYHFLQNEKSATEVLNNVLSQFSGLKTNKSKCEVAGIGVIKGVKVALCDVECVNLLTNAIKVLVIYFSHNRKLENEKNFLDHITKLQKVTNIWKMRNLSLLWKKTVFKTLALSKIIHLALVTNVPTATIESLSKIQKEFLWGKNKSKIKHDTLSNDYENGGLKSVDIFSKIVGLQCSWIRRLFDENFHPWKVIPLYLTEMHFGKNFKFHPNFDLRYFSLKIFRNTIIYL